MEPSVVKTTFSCGLKKDVLGTSIRPTCCMGNTVEAVPKSWYDSESSQCHWPPPNTVHAKICEYIKHKSKSDKKWKTYPARILGIYDDLQTAQRKAEKAQTTTDLTSQNEESIREEPRRRKKAKKQLKPRSDSSSERRSTDNSNDDNVYPDISFLKTKIVVNDTSETSQKNSTLYKGNSSQSLERHIPSTSYSDKYITKSQVLCRSYSRSVLPIINFEEKQKDEERSPCEVAGAGKQQAAPSASTSNSEGSGAGMMTEILKEVIHVHLKVDELTIMFLNVMKANVKSARSTHAIARPPVIMGLFPVNEDSLKELETWLTEESNKDLLVQELIRIGGSDLTEVVKKLMYKIFTNEVGMLYSWEGAKKKRVFKNLAIASVIKDVVRNSEQIKLCSETDIVNVIKARLVRSTDRYSNAIKASRKNVDEDDN